MGFIYNWYKCIKLIARKKSTYENTALCECASDETETKSIHVSSTPLYKYKTNEKEKQRFIEAGVSSKSCIY